MNHGCLLIGCLSSALLFSAPGPGATLPLWEVGVGVGTIYLPDYRGADHTSSYTLPFPYFAYYGKLLRVDRSGIQGRLFGTDRVLLNLSLAAGVPVSSRVNEARAGMPNLDPTVEIGPSLDIRLWRDTTSGSSLWFKIPARAVFSLSIADTAQQGWFFSPFLTYGTTGTGPLKRWRFNVSMGPMFADSAYHDYFYEVTPAYATADRPAYSPGGGYSGSRITVSMQRRVQRLWLGVFARYDNLSGAAFADSPLVRTKDYFIMGLGVTWIAAESGSRVRRN
jgi:outer membrane protein